MAVFCAVFARNYRLAPRPLLAGGARWASGRRRVLTIAAKVSASCCKMRRKTLFILRILTKAFCAYQEAAPFSLSSLISSPFGGCVLPCAPLETPPVCHSAMAVCKPQVFPENSGGSAAVSRRREINKEWESVANSSSIMTLPESAACLSKLRACVCVRVIGVGVACVCMVGRKSHTLALFLHLSLSPSLSSSLLLSQILITRRLTSQPTPAETDAALAHLFSWFARCSPPTVTSYRHHTVPLWCVMLWWGCGWCCGCVGT